ncbi:MAG: Hsp70 family protein, partial [Planctomycetaceae bacterium]|nr:Hsp70 family protein [Planctomycetaceae bacterium]
EAQAVASQQIDAVFKYLKEHVPQEVGLIEFSEFVEPEEEAPSDEDLVEPILLDEPILLSGDDEEIEELDEPIVQPEELPVRKGSLKRQYEIVGIDLGTTFSAIAYVDFQGKAQVVCNPEDQQRPIMPSAVLFEEGEALIGQTAIDNAFVEPDNVVQFAKRSLGERKTFNVGGQSLTPEAISALILKKLIQYATPAIGPIQRTVITVPAFFNEKRRAATVQCGEIAGLKVEATLNEPSAALIAYGLHTDPELTKMDAKGNPRTKNYVVYDLGGGTFDVTVMAVSRNRVKELATGGNRELGGMDWDQALVDYVANEFQAEHGCSPKETSESLQTLMSACNTAKIQLSTRKRTVVMCTHAGRAHRVEVTREKFEQLTTAMLAMTELTVETCLRDANLDWDQVEAVLMVGGSTMMPMVQSMLTRIAGKPPRSDVDPSTVVAQGAAIYAGVLDTQGAIRGAGEHQGAVAPGEQDSESGNASGFVIEQLPADDDSNEDDLELAL